MTRPVTPRGSMHPARQRRLLILHGIVPCGLCGKRLLADDEIRFEHMHQLATGGADDDSQIKPCHKACSAKKTHGNGATSYRSDTHERAKEDRIEREGKFTVRKPPPGAPQQPSRSRFPKGRKIQSRGFQQGPRPFRRRA